MKTAPPELPGWTRRRFWGVVVILFAAQAGLILLFAESGRGRAGLAAGPVDFKLVPNQLTGEQLARTFFADDPVALALPSHEGFSEPAWLEISPPQFNVPDETESPGWLHVDAMRLGTNFPSLARRPSIFPFKLGDQSASELEQWPATLPPESFSNQSSFELQGQLADRVLNPPGDLRDWPSAILLSNTIVQIAVDTSGQVVAARLLGRSGLAEADLKALDRARRLRFRPAGSGGPVWGRAVFLWQTVEPTNATRAVIH